ncbi:alpha/beta hydrolase [Cellulosimicrobium marinum]|uniref:alpha/beta hydrolase n=1 Tax=Cellulosimicrobium marinum TaxID=1638992 RepID=UPI001E31A633|nr:alpha/beta hydrolase [Cellulosimicrobium marinum]
MTVGTFVWQAPVIGLVGSLGGYLPGWLIVVALGGVAAGLGAWSLRRQARLVAGVVACTLCAVGGGIVIRDQTQALDGVGVDVVAADFFGPFLAAGDGPDDVVEFGPVHGETTRMGVYRPSVGGERAPVVVHVHGGGFTSGDIDDDSAFARYLNDLGYLVFTPHYLLATEERPSWDVAPAQIVCALQKVGEIAAEYGGDGAELFVTGSSAGGNMAPIAANAISAGEDLGADCGPMPVVSAVAISIPATDVGFAEGTPYAISGDLARDFAEAYTGGTPEEVPDRYAAVDAAGSLTPESPPTLLVFGENDWLVASQASLTYAQRARALGVDVQAVGVPWTGHLIGLSGAGSRAIAELTARWFVEH